MPGFATSPHSAAVAAPALSVQPPTVPPASFLDSPAAASPPKAEDESQLGGEQLQSAPAPVRASVPPVTAARAGFTAFDLQKMKIEILRLQGLVHKLQVELEAEREYARALESHIKTLQDADIG